MNDTTIILLGLISPVIGVLIWLYLKDYFDQLKFWKAAVIKSLAYSFFFGIGALGEGGGEPGFLLPYPVSSAAFVSLTEKNIPLFIENALLPFGWWALVLFMAYIIRDVYRKLMHRKRKGTKTDAQLS